MEGRDSRASLLCPACHRRCSHRVCFLTMLALRARQGMRTATGPTAVRQTRRPTACAQRPRPDFQPARLAGRRCTGRSSRGVGGAAAWAGRSAGQDGGSRTDFSHARLNGPTDWAGRNARPSPGRRGDTGRPAARRRPAVQHACREAPRPPSVASAGRRSRAAGRNPPAVSGWTARRGPVDTAQWQAGGRARNSRVAAVGLRPGVGRDYRIRRARNRRPP